MVRSRPATALLASILLLLSVPARGASVAFTIDDFRLDEGPLLGAKEKDEKILETLKRHLGT